MEELAELFHQVNQYVEQQEEQVEQIDMQGEQVVVDVNKANTELDTGIKQARSRNRKKWWCLLICSKFLSTSGFRGAMLIHRHHSPHHCYCGRRCRRCRRSEQALMVYFVSVPFQNGLYLTESVVRK